MSGRTTHLPLALAVTALLCSVTLFGQDATRSLPKGKKHRIGLMVGYGSQRTLTVPYDYRVTFYQAQYFHALPVRGNWNLEFLFQPQYNTTRYRPQCDLPVEATGYELGLNAGVLLRRSFRHDLVSVYAFISAGPHYVSGVPERQAEGFLFSDNLFIGVHVRLTPKIYLDLRVGFRHMSNASLRQPNGGINNTILSGGLAFDL